MRTKTPLSDQSFSMDKGLVDPLTEHKERIENYLDTKDPESNVRFLNKKRKSKIWKLLTTNII